MHHEYYMRLAIEQAKLAADMDEVPVGAVLLSEHGQLFSAHNKPIAQHDATAHAEIEVMRLASQHLGNYRLLKSTLYVTLEPCLMCAGAMIHARVGQVIYGATDVKTGAVNSLYHVLSDVRLNHQPKLLTGILAEECADLLTLFFKRRRREGKVKQALIAGELDG